MALLKRSKKQASSTSRAKLCPLVTHSPEETQKLGKLIAAELEAGDVLLLHGDLGSGKTTFVQGLARAMGVQGYVRSSSFMLVNEYRTASGNPPLFHVDLYRLDGGDLDAFGLEEYMMGKGICVIEWAEKLPGIEARRVWDITLAWRSDTERTVTVQWPQKTCASKARGPVKRRGDKR